MEEKKVKGTFFGFSRAREEDVISKLPDSLISEILLYLPAKEAVKTSVLSNRWKSLWLLIPELDLDSSEFPDYNAFATFMDKCLDFYREEKLCLQKLKLSVHKDENANHQSCVTRWIDFVATHKLKHLDVKCYVKRKYLEVMPLSLFICETLVYLRLCQVLFGSSFEESSSVSLPCLKTMRLELNVYANERSLESFISYCPVLEDLSVVRGGNDKVKVLRVRSQTLTSLSMKYDREVVADMHLADFKQLGILIDAPRLEYLNFEDEISYSKTITSSGYLTKVNILEGFILKCNNDQVGNFFTSLSGVKDLKISYNFYTYIHRMVPLPQFCNLSSLEAELSFNDLEALPRLLASCPNLKSLILCLLNCFWKEKWRHSPVPLCLLSSLEFVEIKCNFDGDATVVLARYFAENSVILKKLVMCLSEENSAVTRDLLALPRRSSSCQIIVC